VSTLAWTSGRDRLTVVAWANLTIVYAAWIFNTIRGFTRRPGGSFQAALVVFSQDLAVARYA